MLAQRDVVQFLAAYHEVWPRFFPDLNRRGQWHIISHLCVRGRTGAPVGELSGLVKQVFLLDDATVRERLSEIYRLGFCTVEPADRPVSARTVVLPTTLLMAKFDAHLIDAAKHLLIAVRAAEPPILAMAPTQVDAETRRHLVRAVECCNEAWLVALEKVFDQTGLSTARRLDARRHLLSPSHHALTLAGLRHRYEAEGSAGDEGVLADEMAAELLRLLRQNFQTTRDHIAYLVQLGLLERRPGRVLRVALARPVAAELDAALAPAAEELIRIAAAFPSAEQDADRTGVLLAVAAPAKAEFMPEHILVVTRPGHPQHRVVIGAQPLMIGRLPSSTLVLDDNEVSRTHCTITLTDETMRVTDLGSTNGTFVDGRPVTQETVLTPGAVLQVGPYRLVHELSADLDVDGTVRRSRRPSTGKARRHR